MSQDRESAVATLRFAVLNGLTKRAPLTGLRAGPEMDMMLEDIVNTIQEQPFRWALKKIGEDGQG